MRERPFLVIKLFISLLAAGNEWSILVLLKSMVESPSVLRPCLVRIYLCHSRYPFPFFEVLWCHKRKSSCQTCLLLANSKEDRGWQKRAAAKMQRLDSFMREVQRLNPPSACACDSSIGQKETLGTYSFSGIEEDCTRAHRSIRWFHTSKRYIYLRSHDLPYAKLDQPPWLVRRMPLLQANPGLW